MSLYEVEEIVDKRFNLITNQIQYKVKWIGYDQLQSTWEPISHLQYVQMLIDDFQNHFGNVAPSTFNNQIETRRRPPKKQLVNSNTFIINNAGEQISSVEIASEAKEKRRGRSRKHRQILNQIEVQDKQSYSSQQQHKKRGGTKKLNSQADKVEQQPVNINLILEQQLKVDKMQNIGHLDRQQAKKQNNNLVILQLARNGPSFIFLVEINGQARWMTKRQLVRKNMLALIEFYQNHLQIYEEQKVKIK